MKNMDIMIIAHFSGEEGATNSRFRELASILSRRGAKVELVTSSFLHHHKRQRDTHSSATSDYRITYIDEPDYPSNVSLRRIRSHRVMGKNLERYLRTRTAPDVVFCAVPSLDVASAAAAFANRHERTRLILDIQDLWPEAFEMVLKPKGLAHLALLPMQRQAERIYRAADEVVSVSDTYSQRVIDARGSEKGVSTTYLGTNLTLFDQIEPQPFEDSDASDDTVKLAYIGTLGHSYDLPVVFDALRELKQAHNKVVLHVMGSGPLEEKWRADTADLGDQVHFHGRLLYPDMVSRLRSCDIAVNPIVPGAAQSIINKVCDYAAAGLPVVSTQECEEYRTMLSSYAAGITCLPDPTDVAGAITELASDPTKRKVMSRSSRRLAEENFDRSVTYERLADRILNEAD